MFTTIDTAEAVERSSLNILKALDIREEQWTEDQMKVKKEKIKENIKKRKRANDFVDVLLKKCKEHGGPVATGVEVSDRVESFKGSEAAAKQALRQEIQYQRVTHTKDVAARPDLYRVNKVSVDDMRQNLIALVEDIDLESGC